MTPEMQHVWQVQVLGGPLTMDPTDQQVVEGAIMAQQDGQATVSPASALKCGPRDVESPFAGFRDFCPYSGD